MSDLGIISKVKEISSLEELRIFVEKDEKTILFIGTDWCPQSRSMARVIAKLSKEIPEVSFLVASLEDGGYAPCVVKIEFKSIFGV